MNKKFELGPIQKAWIKSLRDNHKRQQGGCLGTGTPEDYNACCLGEGLVVLHKMKGLPPPFKNGKIVDTDIPRREVDGYPEYSYKELGLHDDHGRWQWIIPNDAHPVMQKHDSLSKANDNGVSWLVIADLMEKHPEAVFNKSV